MGELQDRCASLEEEKFEVLSRLRSSIQLAEEVSLQKEQVSLLPLNSEMFSPSCVFYPYTCSCGTVGSAQREAESRRTGEDEGGDETARTGRCCAH